MVKSFLILILFQIFLFANQQTVLVISDDFNTSKASLECFEDGKKVFKKFDVNIGKNGLGFGLGEFNLTIKNNQALKYEGDKKAPIGVFKLTHIFGYKKDSSYNMPYLHVDNKICVDDSNDKNYNKIIDISTPKPKSFEYMRRKDKQYELGIVVAHNEKQVKQRGSCIFLHVEKFKGAGTVGCTSMSLKNIKKIVNWLDVKKNPLLIQIPKSSLKEVYELYPELKD